MEKEFSRFEAQGSFISVVEAFKQMRTALARQRTGNYLILWGLVNFTGYVLSEIFRVLGRYDLIGISWLILSALGVIGTVIITLKLVRRTKDYFPEGSYIGLIWIALVFYSLIIWATFKIGGIKLSGIQASLLWLNFAMLGYVLTGIFLGREIAIIGIAVSVFSILSAMFLLEFFNIAMALICLFVFVGGGLYINKKWDVKK